VGLLTCLMGGMLFSYRTFLYASQPENTRLEPLNIYGNFCVSVGAVLSFSNYTLFSLSSIPSKWREEGELQQKILKKSQHAYTKGAINGLFYNKFGVLLPEISCDIGNSLRMVRELQELVKLLRKWHLLVGRMKKEESQNGWVFTKFYHVVFT
jgi:hypothetical protein